MLGGRVGKLLILALAFIAALLLFPLFGIRLLPASVYFASFESSDFQILWLFRWPRVWVALVAGAALALGGCAFQALFRNGLADPFTLGLSSGASAGMAAALHWGVGVWVLPGLSWGLPGLPVCAFVGALAATGIVYGLSRMRRGFSTSTLLLAGVATNFFFSAIVTLFQQMGDPLNVALLLRALVGGVAVVGHETLLQTAPFIILGGLFVLFRPLELNLFACGEELARTRGVSVRSVRRQLFWGVSLMTAGVVALCGPVGFVGLMAPHICRLWIGPDHRWLIPASMLFGGLLLASADLVARIVIAPAELPAGAITALFGGPFFLFLLWRDGAEGFDARN